MNKTISAGITGTGSFLPEKRLKNSDLEKLVETTDEWIVQRTGISERRIIEDGVPAADMGVEAAKRAIEDAGITADDIDIIIVSTITPDASCPTMACTIQGKLGAKKAFAFDMNAACTGFIYGLSIAEQYIKSGTAKHVLVMAVEALSRATDWKDRKTCILFGDGAGAAVLSAVTDETGIQNTWLGANGAMGHVLTLPNCLISEQDRAVRENGEMRVLWMDGSEVMKFASRIMAEATIHVCEAENIKVEDLALIIPHQANIRILQSAMKRLPIEDKKVYSNLSRTGNISSAGIPVALDEVARKGLLKKGDPFVLVGFGGGLTWGASLIRWSK